MPPLTTKSSTPRLSEVARHVIVPKGAVSTGWPAVQAKCADLGIRFRPWQPGVGRIILCKRRTGKYAATIGGTGLSIPRQVGKTFLVGAIVFALCLLRPNLTVIWTAHRLRVAEETFGKMQVFAKRAKIKPHVKKVTLGSGEEEITFHNGSRILFGARERGFGRGFDEVDILIFDEAQILSDHALDDMIPATNQSRQDTGALLLFMGTPPKPGDPSEVFTRMRTEALAGEDSDTGWIEFGADPGFEPTPKPAPLTKADWEQVAKANPSYPTDTPRESILRMRKQLTADSFPREGLGIWDELQGSGPISMPLWHAGRTEPPESDPLAFGLDMTWGREFATIGWFTEDYCDIHAHRKGVGWVVKECQDLQEKYPEAAVWTDPKGPAATLIEPLREAGVWVEELSSDDYRLAVGAFRDAVTEGELKHSDDPDLDAAVEGALLTASGLWDRKKGAVISPLVAVTHARHGALQTAAFNIW